MAIDCTKEELISVLSAKSVGDTRIQAQGCEFDSREIKGGEIFVTLSGSQTHGENFIQVAYDRGAALFIVENASLLDTFVEPERLLVVKDSLKAFQTLANWWRRKLALPVLAITGSVGKTTIKELVAGILLQDSLGCYSRKSFNNHVGVPYSICQTARRHKWLVLEMGMNNLGELSILSKIAEPDVVLISKISPAHIGRLGSLELIAQAKLEIVEGLKPAGILVSNNDDEFLQNFITKSALRADIKHLRYGQSPNSDLSIQEVKVTASLKLELALQSKNASAPETLQLNILGAHNASNVAAAILSAESLLQKQLPWQAITRGLKSYVAPEGRLKLRFLRATRAIVDDCYNANPDSMDAMLTLAKQLSDQGQRIGLMIGDMLEMGEQAADYHLKLFPLIIAARPAFVVLAGEEVKILESEIKAQGISVTHIDSAESAAHLLHKLEFNYLLIKASHGIGLEATVSKLIEIEGEVLAPPEVDELTESESENEDD